MGSLAGGFLYLLPPCATRIICSLSLLWRPSGGGWGDSSAEEAHGRSWAMSRNGEVWGIGRVRKSIARPFFLRHRDACWAAEEEESRTSLAFLTDSERVQQFNSSSVLPLCLSRLQQKIWWLLLQLWRIPGYGGMLGGKRSGGGWEYFLQWHHPSTTL